MESCFFSFSIFTLSMMLLLFSLVATVVAANDAPTIEAGPDGVIISVPDGSKVWARSVYPNAKSLVYTPPPTAQPLGTP